MGGVAAGWYDFANNASATAFPINQPYFNALRSSFTLQTLDVSFLAGNPNVAFRYVFKSDGSINNAGVVVDDFQISGPVNDALPVEFLSFTGKAKEKCNELNWVTATEINNLGFEIERSASGFVWEKIGFVSGAGNTVTPSVYAFQDKQIDEILYYYRLKQIDFNGKFEYTKTISITRSNNSNLTVESLYPNPFTSFITLNMNELSSDEVRITLYDLSGAEVFSQTYPAGIKSYFIDFSGINLSSSTYILKADFKKEQVYRKIISSTSIR